MPHAVSQCSQNCFCVLFKGDCHAARGGGLAVADAAQCLALKNERQEVEFEVDEFR